MYIFFYINRYSLICLPLAKNYEAAIAKYTEAINLNPNVAQYYANRSFAHIKTEAYGSAVEDAERAVKVDPTYVKVRNCSVYQLVKNY